MMEFITGGSLSNALAPRLEVGQEALYDALRTRDAKRATRIIKRVASGERHQGSRAAGSSSNSGRRVPEVSTDGDGLIGFLLLFAARAVPILVFLRFVLAGGNTTIVLGTRYN